MISIMADLNVLLDVLQKREDFYESSKYILELGLKPKAELCIFIPAHALTTINYIMQKSASKDEARKAIQYLIRNFNVAVLNKEIVKSALELPFNDLEDAVVASSASHYKCLHIITRNLRDFQKSTIPPLSPKQLIDQYGF
jgi:predicted nucleic-acid-binding protein